MAKRFVCRDCGYGFDRPAELHSGFAHAFGYRMEMLQLCPNCGSGNITEAAGDCANPDCCNTVARSGALCRDCRKDLRRTTHLFLRGLTGPELEQLADWLEGSDLPALKEQLQKEADHGRLS